MILNFTDPEHVHVSTARGEPIVLRGVSYSLKLHLNVYDECWSRTRDKEGREEYHYLNLTKVRADGSPIYDKNTAASDSARDKVEASVAAAFNIWVQCPAGRRVLVALAAVLAAQRLSGARGRVLTLQRELKEAEAAVIVAFGDDTRAKLIYAASEGQTPPQTPGDGV